MQLVFFLEPNIKTRKHLYIFRISFAMFFCSSILAQNSIQLIQPQSGVVCDGSFEFKASGSSIYPIDVYLIQSLDTISHSKMLNPAIIQFDSLCAGRYQIISVNTFGCDKPLEAFIPSCEGSFDLEVLSLINPPNQANPNGLIEIQAIPVGSYKYLWSNGLQTPKLTGLLSGTYSVTVTEIGTNCTLTKEFLIDTCNYAISNQSFDIDLLGGISSNGVNAQVNLKYKASGQDNFQDEIPSNIIVTWYSDGDLVNTTSNAALGDINRSKYIEVSVTDGCSTKRKKIDLIGCNSDDSVLENYFIVAKQNTCKGQAGGSITIRSNIPMTSLQVNGTVQNGLVASGLLSGKNSIRIVTNFCDYQFDVVIGENKTNLVFVKFDSKSRQCIYNSLCNGMTIGQQLISAEIDNLNPKIDLLSSTCKAPYKCNGNAVGEYSDKVKLVKVRGYEYNTLINELKTSSFGTFPYGYFEGKNGFREFEDWCAVGYMCPLNFQIGLRHWHPGTILIGKPSFTNLGVENINGCVRVKCRGILNNYTFCTKDFNSKFGLPGTFKPCFTVAKNVGQLILEYKMGKYASDINFNSSSLRLELDRIDNKYENERFCATIYFCEESYKFISCDIDFVLCGFRDPADAAISCEWKRIRNLSSEPGVTGELYIFAMKCKNINGFYFGPQILTKKRIDITPTNDDDLTPITLRESDPSAKIYTDTRIVNKSLGFGKLTYNNLTVIKPILKTDAGHVVIDYLPGETEDRVLELGNVIDFVHNMDSNWIFAIEPINNTEFSVKLSKPDTSYTNVLKTVGSSSYLRIKKIMQIGDQYFIAGFFKGDITYKSIVREASTSNKLFVLKFNKAGDYISKYTATVIDTNFVKFYDHPGNQILYTTEGKNIFILNANLQITTNYTPIILIGKIISVSSSVLSDRILMLKGTFYAEGTTTERSYDLISYKKASSSYILSNIKTISIKGGISNEKQAQIFMDKNNDSYLLTRISGNDGLKIFSSLELDGLSKDIAIVKFDSTLAVKKTYIKPTPYNETLENAFLSENVLYFSGIYYDTIVRSLGVHNYYNYSNNASAPYTTYILTDQMDSVATSSSNIAGPKKLNPDLSSFERTPKTQYTPIKMEPNPFMDHFEIILTDPTISKVNIINSYGATISSHDIGNFDIEYTFKVVGRHWVSGIYFIQCIAKNGSIVETKKLMKF